MRHVSNLFNEYIICEESYSSSEVHMNSRSLSLYLKSIVANNPQAIFLCFLVNLFSNLEKKDFRYYTLSHSLTLYYLKVLEKSGIVRLIEASKLHEQNDVDIAPYYSLLNNRKRKNNISTYSIGFIKLRDLKYSDVELLKKLESLFHVPENLMIYREKKGHLTASLNYALLVQQCLNNFKKSSCNKLKLTKRRFK